MGWGYNSSTAGGGGCRGVPGSGGGGQQLSVVATVWGVTTSSQSGPMGTFAGNGSNNNHPGINNYCTNQSNVQNYTGNGGPTSGPGGQMVMKSSFNGGVPQNGMSVAAGARYVPFPQEGGGGGGGGG